jgi:hypothetical protein
MWDSESMARGWESKSVESQIEVAEARRELLAAKKHTAEQDERQRQREGFQLHRKRVLHDLETAPNSSYREQLEAALQHLDKRIAELS